jgi:hypothetical protein
VIVECDKKVQGLGHALRPYGKPLIWGLAIVVLALAMWWWML